MSKKSNPEPTGPGANLGPFKRRPRISWGFGVLVMVLYVVGIALHLFIGDVVVEAKADATGFWFQLREEPETWVRTHAATYWTDFIVPRVMLTACTLGALAALWWWLAYPKK